MGGSYLQLAGLGVLALGTTLFAGTIEQGGTRSAFVRSHGPEHDWSTYGLIVYNTPDYFLDPVTHQYGISTPDMRSGEMTSQSISMHLGGSSTNGNGCSMMDYLTFIVDSDTAFSLDGTLSTTATYPNSTTFSVIVYRQSDQNSFSVDGIGSVHSFSILTIQGAYHYTGFLPAGTYSINASFGASGFSSASGVVDALFQVPEPSALGIIFMGGLAMRRRRRPEL